MELKPGVKTSSFIALVAGILVSVIPSFMSVVPKESVWVPVLGAVLAACTYIAGRSWVTVTAIKADALKAQGVPAPGPLAQG